MMRYHSGKHLAQLWCALVFMALSAFGEAPAQSLPAPESEAPTPIPAPSTEPTLFSRAQAETLLATSGGGSQFEIVMSDRGAATLRHRASGMVCRFRPEGANSVTVAEPVNARSHVGCRSGPFPNTIYAAMPGRIDLDGALQGATGYFRRRHNDARAFSPPGEVWPTPSQQERLTHLVSQTRDETSVFHAAAVRRGQWTIIYITEYSFRSGEGPGDLVGIAMDLASAAALRTFLSDFDFAPHF